MAQVAVQKHETDILILEGLGTVSKLIYRYSVFEDYYLRGSYLLQDKLRRGLEGPLKAIYGSMLLFLLEALKHYKQDAASIIGDSLLLFALMRSIARSLEALVSAKRFQELMDDITKNEEEVQRYERLDLKKLATDQYLALRTFMGAYDDRLKRMSCLMVQLLLKLKVIIVKEREDILDWISNIDHRGHHKSILERLMQGTGEWLLDKEQFVQWHSSSSSSLLWLRGDGMLLDP